jgi:hypothetical protein
VDALRFTYEWERGDGVATPELAATWARLEVWVGSECVTRVEDILTGSARRSIYCSLYPLAEWIAFNWWPLTANIRPAAFPKQARLWGRQHNFRAAADGFIWPNLMLWPQGSSTFVRWRSDAVVRNGAPVRYISSGDAFTDSIETRHSLSGIVESVLVRLEEMGFGSSPLS